MSHPRSAALAACVSALVLAPAAHAGAAGGSCADPQLWHLSSRDVARVAGPPLGQVTVAHGPLRLLSDRNDPFAVGPKVTVTGSGETRVCSVRGYYADRRSFAFPGTIGTAAHPSLATRWFAGTGDYAPQAIVVAYAARTRTDGTSCDDPAVVYGDTLSPDGQGDLGARIRAKVEYDGRGGGRTRAEWQTAARSRTCAVHGWDKRGHAFTLRAPRDGSHRMSEYAVTGNHDTPLVYLWIEFTR